MKIYKVIFIILISLVLESGIVVGIDVEDNFDDLLEQFETDEQDDRDEDTFLSKNTNAFKLDITGENTIKAPFPIDIENLYFDGYLKNPRVKNRVSIEASLNDIVFVSNWALDILLSETNNLGTNISARPQENVIIWYPGSFSLGLGFQIFNWGVSDKVNPTDNFNPCDYSKEIEPEKIPVFSIFGTIYPASELSLEGVLIPYPGRSIFPKNVISSISPLLFTQDEIIDIDIPFSLKSFIAGGRLSYYSPVVDLSISYIYDYDEYYLPEVDYVAFDNKNLNLEYERMHRIGADFKSTIDRFGLWLEVCANLTENINLDTFDTRKPYLTWTFGTDFNFGPDNQIYLNFQHNGTYVFGFDDEIYKDYPGGMPDLTKMMTDPEYSKEYLTRILIQDMANQTEALLLGFIFNLDLPLYDSSLVLSIPGAYYIPLLYDTEKSTRLGSLSLSPKIGFKPQDSFEIVIGSELIYSWYMMPGSEEIKIDKSDRIGIRNTESNVYILCKYSWTSSLH